MKQIVSRALMTLALVVTSSAALSAIAPADAQAGGCWNPGPDRSRTFGNGIPVRESYHTWYCYAYRSGDVLNSGLEGTLFAGTSWFVCQRKWPGYNNPSVGSAQNDWWLFTLGDVAASPSRSGWGWFPATKISGGGNWSPIPGRLPQYNTVAGSWVTAGPPTYGP